MIQTTTMTYDQVRDKFYASRTCIGCQPKGWRRSDTMELATSIFFAQLPVAVGYEQFTNDPDGNRIPWMEAQLFYFADGTGFAFEHDFWKAEVYVYRFGCRHEYEEITRAELYQRLGNRRPLMSGSHDHIRWCNKCGYWRMDDSSD